MFCRISLVSLAGFVILVASNDFAHAAETARAGFSSSEILIAILSLVVIGLGSWSWAIRRRAKDAIWRDPAVLDVLEGSIAVCSGLQVLMANRSFHDLLGLEPGKIPGTLITAYLLDVTLIERLIGNEPVDLETEFVDQSGQPVAVAVKARSIDYRGAPARLLEIRDIRLERATRERVSFLAHHDGLTRLPNRSVLTLKLEEAIERARDRGSKCAIAWIDLDRFKMINDVFGHAAGDALLRALADRLTYEIPADAILGRMGGDEFMVLLDEIDDPSEARLLGQQLRRLLNKAIVVDGLNLDCGASIGTAVFPDDGQSAEELMRNADLALYDAKAEGRGRCRHFTPALSEALERRLALASDLKIAIEQREIQAFFQPAVRSSDFEIIGFEALARWTHPKLGPIAPPEFVRIAEENGLASSLAELMISSAIEAAKSWPAHVHIGVNISPMQLNREFVEVVRSALRANEFDPARLEIEVTEDALIRDFDLATLVFSRLREFGVQVAMDDFGAGFTTLGNLKRLNFDRVKLDRSIVQDVAEHRRAAAIVRSLFVLARELGIGLTVEGIETVSEVDHLRAEGECDIQGYYFSKPQPRAYWDDFELRAAEIREKRGAEAQTLPRLSNVISHAAVSKQRRVLRVSSPNI